MDVEGGTFKQSDPKKIARAIEHDAEASSRRKSTPYRSAMSMLTFYMNRAGRNLTAKQRKILEEAKDVLRAEFGPDAPRTKGGSESGATKAAATKAAAKKKAPAKKAAAKTAAKKQPTKR